MVGSGDLHYFGTRDSNLTRAMWLEMAMREMEIMLLRVDECVFLCFFERPRHPTSLYAAKDDEAQPQARPRSRAALLPLLSSPLHPSIIGAQPESERLSNHARLDSIPVIYISWQ